MKIIYIKGTTGSGKTTALNKIVEKNYILSMEHTPAYIKSICSESKEIGIDDVRNSTRLDEMISICAEA